MEGSRGGSRVLRLLLRKVKGIFILFCFPISLNTFLPASSALHSFSEAFHAFSCTVTHSGLSLSLSLFFPFFYQPSNPQLGFFDKAMWRRQLI